VVLADDDVLLREGLASLLERKGFDIVGQCGDPTELISLIREHQPELAIVDKTLGAAFSNGQGSTIRLYSIEQDQY